MKTISHSEADTFGFASAFAATLSGGEVIVLSGQLGAGKTVFVKGLASGLGVTEEVTSPTFALMNEYDGRLKLYHFDVYRLKSGAEAYEAGLTDYFGEEGSVSCVEWADNIADALPRKIIRIAINYLGDGIREISVSEQ
ncbi:MAG: tRNA (adenosine(37)-N6)-threonylcarbamoyltransferase complex ATPase subunit type 1 TsaE [Christensenellales bacterium]|jgi:hydrolase, P-loop family